MLKFLFSLLIVLAILGGIVCGGFFILDRVVVPKYFSEYGINNMSDLVGLMRTMYSMPKDKEILTNAYSATDLSSATKKLQDAEYPVFADGIFDFESFSNGQRGKGDITLTDRELAAVIDKLLDSTEFSAVVPNLSNIDTLNINCPEFTISPYVLDGGEYSNSKARVKAIFKIETTEVRSQMAEEMDIPMFLLNMIFPSELYITCDYDVEIVNDGDDYNWQTSNGSLVVNGSSEEKSELFLNLLISFVFSEEDQMTITKLLENFGEIMEQGTELFGKIEFASNVGLNRSTNGIYFLPVE